MYWKFWDFVAGSGILNGLRPLTALFGAGFLCGGVFIDVEYSWMYLWYD